MSCSLAHRRGRGPSWRALRPAGGILARLCGVEQAKRASSTAGSGALPGRPCRGFQRREHGLEWHASKNALLAATSPRRVLVGVAYEYEAPKPDGIMGVKKVLKYSSFSDHHDYWDCISQHAKEGLPHNLHEIFPAEAPRCLYFDLDSKNPALRVNHPEIISWLRHYVRWVFGGDRRGWDALGPEVVVLSSSNPDKYSSHVVFPEIQFKDFQEQQAYIRVLLHGLGALKVDLAGGTSVPILEHVVDCVPYSQFQAFRGPLACKLTSGWLRPETRLEPEGLFRDDPLACFAGYANPDYALQLEPVETLLAENEELRFFVGERHRRMAAAGPSDGYGTLQDQVLLYHEGFQRRHSGIIDFAGLMPVEQYELALQWLHPERASGWWNWFRISGVTCKMLELHGSLETNRRRIWNAHFKWSSSYPGFDAEENIEMVEKARGKLTSGLSLLLQLVQYDNPGMQVRRSATSSARGGCRGSWAAQPWKPREPSAGKLEVAG